MKQVILTITENTALTPTTWRMKLAGDVSAVTAPGQFIDLRLDGHFLRRPISVNDVEYGTDPDGGDGTVTIIYKVLGHGTEEMTHYLPGRELDVLTGLGNGYDLSDAGEHPLLIGGGVGIPPLYLAARQLMQRVRDGSVKDVTVILGFNSEDEMYYVDEFEELGCRVAVATADGSCGVKGFVTDAFRALVTECGSLCIAEAFGDENDPDSEPEYVRYTHFFTCGPEPMLRALYKEVYEEAGISGQMSFEERMGCGFGACMGCSCRTVTGYKRICKDGPVLRTEEILWQK
ncbi:MAG: dihydroorotate dehydrogenase electron transfer subunit [Mogibacterium sp.]|nr:dihydroorotate dehydrogenase electron transfer subunit [Mogibacterium sp.]